LVVVLSFFIDTLQFSVGKVERWRDEVHGFRESMNDAAESMKESMEDAAAYRMSNV
jgi:hypothetical protein